jgi:hypothetical protein
MTLDTSLSRAQFEGNGAATEFPFNFKVWDASEISVSVGLPNGISEIVAPDAVTLTDSGGTVTYTRDGAPLPVGYTLGIVRSMPFVQPDDYISGTRFDAEVIERSLDVACAERQQLREALSRAVIVDPSSDTVPLDMVNKIFEARNEAVASAGNAATSETNAANSASAAASSATAAAGSASSAADSAEESAGILQQNKEIEDNIENMVLNMANASISKKVFLYGAGEREDVVPAGTPFTVPTYQVGVGAISVFIDSTLAIKDRDYEEIGDNLSMSTQIKLTSDLHPYHELTGEVLSAVVDPDDPSAVQRITALEDRIDSVIPLPVGFVAAYAGTDEPLGWRRLDGQTITGVSSVSPDFKKWAVDDGHAVLCTLEEYETELATYEGQCGKFGWDASSDTLRLPTISAYIRGTTSVSEIGTAIKSGLPNATGNIGNGWFVNAGEPSNAFYKNGSFTLPVQQSNTGIVTDKVALDLSRSSPIYGRSPNSVTPPSVRYTYIIKVADAVYPPSVMDARKMATLVSSLREEVPGMAAHAAGPSVSDVTNIEISVPSSGTEYSAPADGYIRVQVDTAANYGWMAVKDNGIIVHNTPVIQGYQTVYMVRALQGSVYTFLYGNINTISVDFIYASGNAPA